MINQLNKYYSIHAKTECAEFVVQRSLKSSVGENLSGGSWNATRAEMAVMLQQFVKLTEK